MEQRNREQWYSKLFRIFNSGVCFSLAYIIFTHLSWFAMGMVGKIFKFDSFIYYYGIKFILNNHSWTRLKVTLVYSTAPVFFLVAGLLCLYFFDKLKNIKSLLNVFFLWGFVIGSAVFASQGIISSLGASEYNSPYYQNFAVVFAWLHIPVAIVYAFTVPFLILMVYFSVNYARLFLIFAYSYTKVNKLSRRRKYFVEIAIMPFFLGALITSVVTFPMNIFIHGIYLLMIGLALLVSWIALFYIEVMKDTVIKYKTLQSPNIVFLFLLIAVITFVIVTWKGLYLSVS